MRVRGGAEKMFYTAKIIYTARIFYTAKIIYTARIFCTAKIFYNAKKIVKCEYGVVREKSFIMRRKNS